MSFQSAGYQLLPVLPELVLAIGAMVLLMIGAYNGQRTTSLVTTLAKVAFPVLLSTNLESPIRNELPLEMKTREF